MPFLYEFKKTITSKTIIILSIVVVIFSLFAALATVQPQTQFTGYSLGTYQYGYGSNDTYHIVVYAYGEYGLPMQGAQVNMSPGTGPKLYGQTDAQGYANFTITNMTPAELNSPGPKNFASDVVQVAFNASFSQNNTGGSEFGYLSVYINQTNPYFFTIPSKNTTQNISRYVMSSNSDPVKQDRSDLFLHYEGNVSSASPPVELYYTPFHLNASNPARSYMELSNMNESNMTYYGTYNGFVNARVNPANITSSNNTQFAFALFTPSGTKLTYITATVYSPSTPTQVNTQFYGIEIIIAGIFIPLMAAVAAYVSFGKDKVAGVLESTLVRPVSRRSVIISRYLADTSSVFIASALSFAASSLIFSYYLGRGLPLDTYLIALYAMLVGIAAFIGIVYLASTYLKAQGGLLAVAIGIFLVFDLLWTTPIFPVIPGIVTFELLRNSIGTVAFAKEYILLYYISPTGYMNISNYLVTGNIPIYVSSSSITAADIGVTMENFIIGGLAWISIPLALAVASFLRRD